MQYLLLIYGNETAIGSHQGGVGQVLAAYMAYTEAMKKAGVLRRQQPPAADRGGDHGRAPAARRSVVNGPYAETKEQLGGYYLIDAPDLDAALSWAARCPARAGRRNRGAPRLGDVAKTTAEAAEAVRASYGKLVAFLAARTRDVAGAEDALSEAFAAALADWPRSGIPRTPEAWLLTVARRKLIDAARRRRTGEAAVPTSALLADELDAPAARRRDPRRAPAAHVRLRASGDRRRRPRAAHPAGGARLRRRDDRLGVPRLPVDDGPAPGAREEQDPAGRNSVPRAGADGARRAARRRARGDLRHLRRGLVRSRGHAGAQPRTGGGGDLARAPRRVAPARGARSARATRADAARGGAPRRAARCGGEFVPLHAQDPARWDAALIDEAEALFFSASRMGAPGRFQLEAAVQSAHAARRLGGGPTGRRSSSSTMRCSRSPVARRRDQPRGRDRRALGRPAARPRASRRSTCSPAIARLAEYQPYWAARAALLARTGRRERPPKPTGAPSASSPIRRCAASSRPSCRGPGGPPPARGPRPSRGSRAPLVAGRAPGGRHRPCEGRRPSRKLHGCQRAHSQGGRTLARGKLQRQ